MTATDKRIAGKALVDIEIARHELYRAFADPSGKEIELWINRLYVLHGRPFGEDVEALIHWHEFDQATTIN